MSGLQRAYIVLLGAPGAGKGTQAETLAGELGLPHVSTGDLFRTALKNETPLGLLAKSYMSKGQLVPDDVTVQMVRERLAMPDAAQGALLDGFPRNVDQARSFEALLSEFGAHLTLVPYIKVSTDVLLERLAGRWTCRNCGAVYHVLYKRPAKVGVCGECGGELYQRADDTPETQKRRIDVYLAETAPLVELYAQRGVLAEIGGEQFIEAVHRELLAAIRDAMGARA